MTEFIWIDDKSNVELGFLVRSTSNRPGLPSAVDRTLSVPGRNGLWDFGADIGARVFTIDCAFDTRDAFELQKRISNLAEHLVNQYGKPKGVELKFRERPDQFYIARFTGSFDIERIMGLGIFSLTFTAFDPFAHLISDPILDSNILLDSDLRLDGEFYTFNISSPQTITIENVGTMALSPQITITGTFTSLTLSASGKSITYTKPLTTGQILVLNGSNLTVKLDGANKLHEITGDFIDLMTGVNDISVSGTNLNCSIEFHIPAKFV